MVDEWYENRIAEYLKKVLEQAEKTGMELTDENRALAEEMVRGNVSYFTRHWYRGFELQRYKAVSEALKLRLERPNPVPLTGDCVLLDIRDGEGALKYEAPMLMGDYYHQGEAFNCLCLSAGPHIWDVQAMKPDEPLPLSVSGGPFLPFESSRLTTQPVGQVVRHFWFWGNGARAEGGLYINRPVLQWGIDTTEGFY